MGGPSNAEEGEATPEDDAADEDELEATPEGFGPIPAAILQPSGPGICDEDELEATLGQGDHPCSASPGNAGTIADELLDATGCSAGIAASSSIRRIAARLLAFRSACLSFCRARYISWYLACLRFRSSSWVRFFMYSPMSKGSPLSRARFSADLASFLIFCMVRPSSVPPSILFFLPEDFPTNPCGLPPA